MKFLPLQIKCVAELMNKTYEELSKLPPIAIFEPEMDINEEEYITDDEKGYEIKRENENTLYRVHGLRLSAAV